MNEKRLKFYQSTLHPMLSIFIPYLFLFTFHHAFRAVMVGWIIPSIPDDVDLVLTAPTMPTAFFIVLLAIGVGEAISANFLSKERVTALVPRLREMLLFLIGGLIFIFLLRGDFSRRGLNPLQFNVIYPLIFVLLQWLLSFVIHRGLKERELFLSLLIGKEGVTLKNMLREFSAEAGDSEKAITRVKRILLFFQVIVILLLFSLLAFGSGVRPVYVVLSFFHVGFGLFFLVLLNHFLEEQSYLGDGLQITTKLNTRWFMAFFVVLALGIILTLIVVGNDSLLPASYIGQFFRGIDEWFANRARDVVPKYKPQSSDGAPLMSDLANARDRLAGDLSMGEKRSEVLANILRIVAFSLLGLIGVGLIVFLVRPLFSKESRENMKNRHPIQFVKSKLLAFFQFVGKALSGIVKWLKSPKKGVRRFTQAIADRLRESPVFSREARLARKREAERSKLRQHGREIRAFVRVIRWGEGLGVKFRKSLGPMAYVDLVGKAVPESQGALYAVAGIFEEIMYSQHSVPESRTEEYFQTIRDLVQTKAS